MSSSPYQNRDEDRITLAIKEQQINVAPENRVRIHVAVINEGTKEEYVDILVRGLPSEWTTVDTPVVHLVPGEAKQVVLTVQPPAVAQSRVGEYPLEVRAVSQNDANRSALARTVVTVAAYQSRGRIGVMLGSIHFAVSPGSSITIPILLQNRGVEEDSFRLTVTGLPANWISTNSALTRLEPSASTEIQLTISVPRSPQAVAGRNAFTIHFTSHDYPTQKAEVECLLTVSAFSEFTAALEPETLRAGQFGQLTINNEGNTADTYTLNFQSPENALIFEKAIRTTKPGPQPGTQQMGIAYVEVPRGERFQIAAGERGVYAFRPRLRSRPFVGGEETYPFTISVLSSENKQVEIVGQTMEKAFIPVWALASLVLGFLVICALFLIPLSNIPTSARATQTAAYNQTQAALSGQDDSDGDGLSNEREAALGTDPLVTDTDGDGLLDGEEVITHLTDPLNPDTDQDGLQDGEELRTHQTNPLNPDLDADGLQDGEEIARGTDPRNPDSDGDGLPDGEEVRLETNPLDPDSDSDGLPDGQENRDCLRPRDPDSDDDGIIDGRDLDPCNPSNPSLTATAIAGAPTPTSIPTLIPTETPVPTSPVVITPTPPPPSLQGLLLFSSNRDGNSEIYSMNLANQAVARLTNSAAQEVQPALAPDSVQVAYVSNQDGNNEIYLGGVDRRLPLNLTNNPADDQQPTWSPDGNWIAFTTNRDGNQEIYIMRSDGSEVRNLTNNPSNDSDPTWFSVGGLFGTEDWLAFTSTRDGNQEIYKVRPDGTGLTNLTQNPANDHSPSGSGGAIIIAFVSDRTGNPEIFTMTDNGGAQTNVTNNPAQDLDPVTSLDRIWIAFATDRDGNLEIYVVRVVGGTAYNLTRDASQDRYPDW